MLPFDVVVSLHGPAVLRMCRALVGASDAEDVWSETFVSALRAYADLQPGSNVEAWLVTIARRRAVDHLRAAGRRARPVATVPDAAAPAGADLADRLDLVSAVALLPPRQRECVVYHHLAGLPYAEVAEVVGGTEAAARRAASDGMRALRALLGAAPPARRDPSRFRTAVEEADHDRR
ncbi:RNA polymerase sigma factor [Sanguibacter suaedae]|uniref:RNA polymerase sigma factor n=1 Tax=Sanguibacter suaedae TaxID=2795737 RepID=A0A934IDW5_9MICO|nr:RNA polymerase sigma factor [Sanguibacter suaedae]MBI9116061.1 RNA polymerase sigma factor [Sanguibacter suaedae]